MKIKGCRPEFTFVLLVVIVFSLIFYPAINYRLKKDMNGEWGFNTDNNMIEMIILSNTGNMPSGGIGVGF